MPNESKKIKFVASLHTCKNDSCVLTFSIYCKHSIQRITSPAYIALGEKYRSIRDTHSNFTHKLDATAAVKQQRVTNGILLYLQKQGYTVTMYLDIYLRNAPRYLLPKVHAFYLSIFLSFQRRDLVHSLSVFVVVFSLVNLTLFGKRLKLLFVCFWDLCEKIYYFAIEPCVVFGQTMELLIYLGMYVYLV